MSSDKPAIVDAESGEAIGWEALERRSNQLANVLRAAGLRRGDGLALLLENQPRFLEIVWAAQRCGLYYTAVSTRLSIRELSHILDDSRPKAVICSPRTIDDAVAATAGLPGVAVRLVLGDGEREFSDYEEAIAGQPDTPVPDESPGVDLLYSAGTTGTPKGIRFPLPDGDQRGPRPFDELLRSLYGIGPSAVYMSPAPLYHAAPLRFSAAALRRGASVVITEKFREERFLAAIDRHRVTHTQVVPTMLVRLLALPSEVRDRYSLESLSHVIHAGAPCPPAVKDAAIDWLGPILHEYYSGTERAGFVASTPADWVERPGTVGRAVVGRVHVLGDDGRELPPGEVGTVYFEGGADFEYLNAPEQTAAAHNTRGWTTMGDVGHVDRDGYLYLAERQAHVIISGGVNIYPQEVEHVLMAHPDVVDAAVIGIPHREMGEEVRAIVQARNPEPGPVLAEELLAYCGERLARYKCPRAVDFLASLPREPTGKLPKHRLQALYTRPSERDDDRTLAEQ